MQSDEVIPDVDRLFYRVPVSHLKKGKLLHPGVFRETEGSISTNWEKYSTAEETRSEAKGKDPAGVLAMLAGPIRTIAGMSVRHDPEVGNLAHAAIEGMGEEEPRKTDVRRELFTLFHEWTLEPDRDV